LVRWVTVVTGREAPWAGHAWACRFSCPWVRRAVSADSPSRLVRVRPRSTTRTRQVQASSCPDRGTSRCVTTGRVRHQPLIGPASARVPSFPAVPFLSMARLRWLWLNCRNSRQSPKYGPDPLPTTGRGARPGGLRYTRFRSARPGGCRQTRSASTTPRSAGTCTGGAALPPASPTAPATDARARMKRSRCRWLGDGAVGAVARCLIDDRLPGTVPGGSFRRWACVSAVAVLKGRQQVIFRVADRNQRRGGRCELLC